MKNILILITCALLYSCGGSSSPDEDVKPDYTTVKQQLPLKLETWENNINSKNFSSAKSISVQSGNFWDKADDAELMIDDNKQITYGFNNYQLNIGLFKPEQGTATVQGKVLITQGTVKTVEEKDFTATFLATGDAELISNWKLNNLELQ